MSFTQTVCFDVWVIVYLVGKVIGSGRVQSLGLLAPSGVYQVDELTIHA